MSYCILRYTRDIDNVTSAYCRVDGGGFRKPLIDLDEGWKRSHVYHVMTPVPGCLFKEQLSRRGHTVAVWDTIYGAKKTDLFEILKSVIFLLFFIYSTNRQSVNLLS